MSDPPPAASGFDTFALDPRIRAAVDALGFDTPTPIQEQAIPALLDGKDVIGGARTGSGKTAAFGLPLLHRVREGGPKVRALLLAPTRELAIQVTAALRTYAKNLPVRIVTIYGGAPYGPQLQALRQGVAVVVGTPGRVLDHLGKGSLDLSAVEVLVLDEADEMLRMGFLEDVERVLDALPDERQIALFSATMPAPIRRIAVKRMKEPLHIQVEAAALTVSHIAQRGLEVPMRYKAETLMRVLASEDKGAVLIFARTRAGCAELSDQLGKRGMNVDALHGDLNQQARERVLNRLRRKQLDAVVATDVAARGIDVEHLTHVINYDLPDDAEQYVHRIGRTGRAGRAGNAISFVTPRETWKLKRLEQTLATTIERMEVPSDAQIAARMTEAIRADLSALEPEAVSAADTLVDALLEERTPRELAQAALAIIARERGLDPSAEPDARPPAWARGKSRPDRPDRPGRPERNQSGPRSGSRNPENAGEQWVALFLAIGKRKGVRPADIVGAITNELGVTSRELGRISILDHKTFVEVTPTLSKRMLEERPQLELRGVQVPVTLAEERSMPAGRGPGGPNPRGRGGPPSRHAKPGRPPQKRWNRGKK